MRKRAASIGLLALMVLALVVIAVPASAIVLPPSFPIGNIAIESGGPYTTSPTVTADADVINANQMRFGTRFKKIEAWHYHAVGLTADGRLLGWGDGRYGQFGGHSEVCTEPVEIGEGQRWTDFAVGLQHTLAIRSDGTLWACGSNEYGELGQGHQGGGTVVLTPVMPEKRWRSVSAGYAFSVAVADDGTAWAWGDNSYGQLGIGKLAGLEPTPTPVEADGKTWRSLDAGQNHTLGIAEDGSLWAWGGDGEGQLGDAGASQAMGAPVRIGGDTDWKSVSANESYSLGLKNDGSLLSWGHNGAGQLGDGTQQNRSAPVAVGGGKTWKAVSAGSQHVLAVASDATLWGWGYGTAGQLGRGVELLSTDPISVSGDPIWKSVAAGWEQSFAIREDGPLRAWGAATDGRLGNGWWQYVPTPNEIAGTWLSVDAGPRHSAGVADDGRLYVWGDGSLGQLGGGLRFDVAPRPEQLGTDSDWSKAAAGYRTTYGIKSDRTLWVVGSGTHGELGLGQGVESAVAPTQIGSASNWYEVMAGYDILARNMDGKLYGWGPNETGGAGVATTTPVYSPTPIGDAIWLKAVSGGGTCAGIQSDGSLWTWGYNQHGMLGNGSLDSTSSPQKVGDGWYDIAVGGSFMVGIKDDGSLWSWGWGGPWLGLGPGPQTNHPNPERVSLYNSWERVWAGPTGQVYARDYDGSIWCWGTNTDHMLGLGVGWNHDTPTLFAAPGSTWSDFSGGYNHWLALKTDGSLSGWGHDQYGQLGRGYIRNNWDAIQTCWQPWEDFAPTRELALGSGDGTKTVDAEFRNAQASIYRWDSIVLDTTPPTTEASIDPAYDGPATIALSAGDSSSGIEETCYLLDGAAEATGTSLFTSVPGEHTVEYWSQDRAGNIEGSHMASFRVDPNCAFTAFSCSPAIPDYNVPAKITATLKSGASGVTGRSVALQKYSGGAWVAVGPMADAGGGRYERSVPMPYATRFRAVFAGDAAYTSATTVESEIKPRAKLQGPYGVPTSTRRTSYFTVTGRLYPRHTSVYPAKLYCYRLERGAWKLKLTASAKESNPSGASYTSLSRRLRLSSAGKWKVRLYAPADSGHVGTWASSTRYVSVR
ncbi:MAG: hypothetical protein HY876_05840 [Coriobacteriales bacterium]|nr:hypothetical protein [Coriobacteriales bacterium]